MTGRARVRDLVSIGHRWRYEAKCMGVNKGTRNAFTFNLRHVARNTLASRTAIFVMRVFFERSRVRPVRRGWPVAIQTYLVCRFDQLSVVIRSMYVMARRAGDLMAIHDALRKVIPLHPVLVRRAIGQIVEIGLPKGAIFELPIVL